MKTKTHIYLLFMLFVLFSCKETNNKNVVSNKNDIGKVIDSVNKINFQHDIYINKIFNGMTELVDVKTVEFEETSIDSIWYGLYNIRNTDVYIFAVDKYLENPDIEQYITIDTVNLNSKNIEVKVENFSDYKTLNLSVDKNFVKKWKFNTYPKKMQDGINSNVEGELGALLVNFTIEGRWITNYAKENLSEDVKYDSNKGTFFMRDSEFLMRDDNSGTFFMKDSAGGYIAKIIVEYREATNSIKYIGATIINRKYMKLDWDDGFKTNSPIAVVKKGDNKKIYLEWKGVYNSKTKKIEFPQNPFNQISNTIILNNCEY